MARMRPALNRALFSPLESSREFVWRKEGKARPRFVPPNQPDWRPFDKNLQLTPEVVLVLRELRVKRSKPGFPWVVKSVCSRLVRPEFLAVLQSFQKEEDIDTALTVFNTLRKQEWYAPSPPLYKSMMKLLEKHRRVEEWKMLLKDLKEEGIRPTEASLKSPIESCLRRGEYDTCMKFFDAVKEAGCDFRKFYWQFIYLLRNRRQHKIADYILKQLNSSDSECLNHPALGSEVISASSQGSLIDR